MQLLRWARSPDADVTISRDINTAGCRAWPDPERQARTASHVTDEEVGFVGTYVPRLRRKPAAAVLFEPDGWRVAGVGVDI